MNKKLESGAVSEEDFEYAFDQTPPIEVSTIKELREVMGGICDRLNSDDWQRRVENLRQIRSVFRGNQMSVDDYLQNLKYMDMELKSCISDLRSQVVREACITVAYLSKEMNIKLDSLVEQLLENLLNLVPNGAKIMSSSGKVALKIIVYHIQSVRILQFFLTSVTTSKSTSIRQFSYEILKFICEKWPIKSLEKNASIISETLKKGINDADEIARSNSREAFCWFNGKFPSIADKLLQSLDSNKQKVLQKELSSFANDVVTDVTDSERKTIKAPIIRQINAPVSAATKTNNGRPRINSANADYQSVKQSIPAPKTDVGNSRGRTTTITQSQPASREQSPSNKSSYITYTNGSTHEATHLNSFNRRTTPTVYSSLRYKDVDSELAERGQRVRKNSYDSCQSDDNGSETSSIMSDQLPSFNELIVLLNSKMWSERKRGLNKTEKYILECHLKPNERKSLIEFFNAMFLENQMTVVKKLLVVLYIFIYKYYEHLNDWLYPLIGKLLNVHSNDRLKSCKPEVNKILKLTIDCFGPPAVFIHSCKYLMDKTQELTIKLKISLLEYMKMILILAQPSLLDSSHSDIGPTLGCIIVMTTEKKSTDLRKSSSSVVIKLFDLNSSQFTKLLKTLPSTFQSRATIILDTYIASSDTTKHNNTGSMDIGEVRTPRQSTGFAETSDFIKMNTEALQNMSMNYDNVERSSVVSNSSNRSVTSTKNWGTYQKGGNHSLLHQNKPDQTSKVNTNPNNNGHSSSQIHDTSNIQRYLSSQNSHPELSIDNTNSVPSQNLYPATSNDSNVDNTYNPEYYNSGPINASNISKGDASSSNAELAPEYVMFEILKELSNHNDRHEERKACLFKLIKIFRQNMPADWVDHFKTLLFLLLENMGDNDADIRAQSLRVLQELAKCQSSKFVDYCQLTILRVLEAHKDLDKSVVKAAEECSKVLTSTMPRQLCFKMLTDILREGNKNVLCFAALKMLTKLIKISDHQCLDSNLDSLSQSLSIVVNHNESAVRKESILCLVDIHKIVGAEIFSRVTLTNSQKRLLEVYIEKTKT